MNKVTIVILSLLVAFLLGACGGSGGGAGGPSAPTEKALFSVWTNATDTVDISNLYMGHVANWSMTYPGPVVCNYELHVQQIDAKSFIYKHIDVTDPANPFCSVGTTLDQVYTKTGDVLTICYFDDMNDCETYN